MGLKLHRGRNGEWRRKWYAQYLENGRWREIPLTTPMAGVMPRSRKGRGDEEFERSRLLAEREFREFDEDRRTKGAAEHLTAKLIQSKTGQGVEYVELADMETEWRKLRPHRRSDSQERNISAWFRLFRRAVDGRRFLYEVTAEDVAGFHATLCARYSKSTVLRIVRFLKGVFSLLLPLGVYNPWQKLDTRGTTGEVVHRRPLGNEEIRKLLDEARRDPTLYQLAVTALCTGLRIGDVANLRWDEVDMREGIISLTTRKTGAAVHIPIFGLLRPVLESALAEREDGGEFVFPAAEFRYRDNPQGFFRAGKLLFARALFMDDAKREAGIEDVPPPKEMPVREVLDAISSSTWQPQKRENAGIVYAMYKLEGKSYRDIQAERGWSRGQISYYLHEIEKLTGTRIVEFERESPTSTTSLLRRTRQERIVGAHAASLFGWHSLRATFVVLALNEGLPLEDVRRIVGHTTADMTLQYYNPTKRIAAERFRRRMSATVLGVEAGAAQGSPALPCGNVPATTGGGDLLALVGNLTPGQRAALKELL